MGTDWKVLNAHVVELEELEDDLLRGAKGRSDAERNLLVTLHRHIIEKRKRLREMQG